MSDAARPGLAALPSGRSWVGALLRSRRTRDIALQTVVLGVVVAAIGYLVGNAAEALRARGIAAGFGYLFQEAGFGIGEGPLAFSPSDTYLRAFAVGLLNTLKVSALAILAATAIGFVVGLMRLSPNRGLAWLASAYVELFRNTPLLLQIVFWYVLLTRLPGPRQALQPLPGVFISNRGLRIPWPADHVAFDWAVGALVAALLATIALGRLAAWRQARTGRRPAVLWPGVALVLGLPPLAWWLAGAPTLVDWPEVRGLNFVGGLALSPEFAALLTGLSAYIGAYVAEIVRSALQAVSRDQLDAARALGLTRGQTYRLVLIPQALRIMVPPLTAQYVSLVKNSALAVAIGYPDLVNISNTTLNQTGRTVEAIVLMSVVYLAISFAVAAAMNLYNAAVAVQER